MRQNIGLFLLTLGSIILGVSVFRLYLIKFYQLEWGKFPWEVRLFCKSIGIRNRENYFKKLLINKKEYVLPDEELKFRDRMIIDLPIIALFLMLLGMFLCLDYSAFCRSF